VRDTFNGGLEMRGENVIEICRGCIFYADLGETIGSEQNGIRPVLIIQNNLWNLLSPTVIAAPITSKLKKTEQAPHVYLGKRFGLTEESMILLEQIRTLDKVRLINYVGTVDAVTMAEVDRAISISLGLSDFPENRMASRR
jgi:mRNA interferase MazF